MSTNGQTVTMNDELNKAVSDALHPDAIRAAVIAEAEKQGLAAQEATAAQEAADRAKAAQEAADKAGASFTRTETIGGKELIFEADSELELERLITNAYRVAYAVQTPEDREHEIRTGKTLKQQQEEDEAARVAAETERAAAKAELELKFKRGDISVADYIEQSGAVDEYLSSHGISVDKLKSTVEKTELDQYAQSWGQATEVFLQGAGADWPGGDKNVKQIGMVVAQLGLSDAEDKVAALAQAYQYMKKEDLLFPGETPAAAAATTAAATTEVVTETAKTAATTVAAPAAPRTERTSSSIFGASSGVGGNEGVSKIAPKGDVKIDPNANPQEIMEAWKRAQIAAGKDPNAAFTETFSARRV